MTDIETMARMWNIEGLSQGEIAAHFGITRHAVAGLIFRHREKFKRRNERQRTDLRRLRTQAAAKVAKAQTAQKPRQPIATASQTANQRRKAFHAVKVAEEAAIASPANCEAITKAEAIAYDAARMPHAKGLMDLTPCDCRWILTADGPHMFCCAEIAPLSPYCQHHKARSKGPGTKSERRAVKDARKAA